MSPPASENTAKAAALNNRGNALQQEGRLEDALSNFAQALQLTPGQPDILFNQANALLALGRPAEALESYDRAITRRPGFVRAHLARANVLFGMERFDEAVSSYDNAIAIDPDFAGAHYERGNALYELGKLKEAIDSYSRAIDRRPDFVAALNNRGNALSRLKRFQEAFESYDAAFKLNPSLSYLEGSRLYAKAHVCDWSDFEKDHSSLLAGVRRGAPVVWPFAFLSLSDEEPDQLVCAATCVVDKYPARPPAATQRFNHDKIRVAYLSADFRSHAMPTLMASAFEEHDRKHFDVTAISFVPSDRSDTRTRLERAFDRFVDASRVTDARVCEIVRELGIDIAIDLMGYTDRARTAIFAQRPAPIQVNYLGFPGTMGADYIDYIIADQYVIRPGDASNYSEKIAYLPNSYMTYDVRRAVSAKAPSRRELGLPKDGFVYCCFNSSHKMTPDVFGVWMEILQQTDNSVLWLLDANAAASRNLRHEAAQRGVSPERLVFAPPVPGKDHLARHRQADLFLDTLPYSAHTGAMDALWMGRPVLTCSGSTFAGRVAGSLLSAAGLPELITTSLDDYRRTAIRLARNPADLAAVREKLARNDRAGGLFDTVTFTRNLEAAYKFMWHQNRKGKKPESFEVGVEA